MNTIIIEKSAIGFHGNSKDWRPPDIGLRPPHIGLRFIQRGHIKSCGDRVQGKVGVDKWGLIEQSS